MRLLQLCCLSALLGGLGGCFWQSAPLPPEPEPQPLSPVAQFMVANAPGATALIQDDGFGGEVRVTLEDTFLSAAGETCKRATLLSAQHEAEIIVICHNGQEGDESDPGEWRLMPRVWGKGITTP
ncbi:DVU3141 family protein [uncultured Bilophila sp.]|uniref:DVU3141 family protein n=1 Tax=uncultured Bilophila sp. TaxID=529385 RepID=UPI0025EEFD59|nr:DVU3141 family protein [uncultured Bilophila sp.]